jgi:spoIIIJ-associated protein
MTKKLEKLAKELLSHLGVKPQSVTVSEGEEKTLNVDIQVNESDSGILIGYHGETINAIQLVLGLMVYKDAGEWSRVVVNVGDYRQKRTDYLTDLAEDTAAKVIESGEAMALYNLNPFERRVVHTALSKNDQVTTESQGEGKNRFLVVSPKNAPES